VVTVVSLCCAWFVIATVCAAACAVARLVGRRVDDVERARSRRQWQSMCRAIGADDLSSSALQESRGRDDREATEVLR
jgi:hypothetical protein